MKKKGRNLRLISLALMAAMLLGMFPASAVDIANSQETANSSFGIEGLNVDAPEVLDPRLQNYTIDKLPEELEENLNLDDTALRFDAADAEDPYSITTINSDGTKTLRVFGEPVKYVDEETDKIEFIDTTLTTAKDSDNAYECVTNSKKSYFPKDISKGVLLTNGKRSVTMTPVISETKKNGKIKYKKVKIKGKNHAQYEDVFGKGTSLQYVPTVNGIKENIVLEEYNGTNTFNYVIDAKKLIPKETEGTTITFIDPETEEEVFKIDETFIYDSRYNTANHDESCVSYNNYYTVEQQKNGKYLLTTTIDKAFLESPETVYPVTVDPEIQALESTQTITAKNVFSNATNVAEGHLKIGGSTDGRVYLKVDSEFIKNLTYINPQNITEAFFKMHCVSGSSSFNVVAYKYLLSTSINLTNYSNLSNPSNLSRISDAPFGTSEYNEIEITSVAKDWINQMLQNGDFVNNGIVLATSSTSQSGIFAHIGEDGKPFSSSPTFQISYFEEHLVEPNVYLIKSSDGKYINKLGEENLTNDLNFVDNPSDSSAWIVQRYGANIGLTGVYMFSSYEQYFKNSNQQQKIKYYSKSNSIYAETYRNGDGNEDPPFLWRIVSNGDNTYRIMSYDSETVAISKSANGVASTGYNHSITAAKFTFELYSPFANQFLIEEKSPSDWPTDTAKSSSNLLYKKTPLLMEYRTQSHIKTTGSGTTYPHDGEHVTDTNRLTDGIISGPNLDMRGYSLKEQGKSGYIRYIDRIQNRYREKGELHLDLAYELTNNSDFNVIWFATNTQRNSYTVGAFEVYASLTSGDLFYNSNKVAEFDKCNSSQWSGVVCLELAKKICARYIGIRITQGVLKDGGWDSTNADHTYARIKDIALFYEEIPVEGVNIDDASMHLYYESLTLKAKFDPISATNRNINWISKNPDIATINPSTGEVTPIAPGTTEIIAITEDGNYRDTCELKVTVGCGGEYREVNDPETNCLAYVLQTMRPPEDFGINVNNQSGKTADFAKYVKQHLSAYFLSCERIPSHDTPINKNEYRIAIRFPNGQYDSQGRYMYHFIYQLSNGNWAGKDHANPSEEFDNSDPRLESSNYMWSDGKYSHLSGTEFFAVTPYGE